MLFAVGDDALYVIGQLGHSDPRFTMRIDAHVMRRGDDNWSG